ncbi:MAG: KamA family radical SAM protein [Chlamydiia bacterium]
MPLPIHTPAPWRVELRKNFTDWAILAAFLELDEANRAKIIKRSHFPLNLPYRLAAKAKKNDLEDPILKQFIPTVEEDLIIEGFIEDPVGDKLSRKCSKLLHKYNARALLVSTSACAMHCRYCFRRNFDYEQADKSFTQELEIIKNDPSIQEIILSGGDPLSLSNEALGALLDQLDGIEHIKMIRFHSRFPLGIPERIDEQFLALLTTVSKQIFFVIHCNHTAELDEQVLAALKKIQRLGIPLLNQSVLLKGVNDDLTTMKALLQKLIENGILPYYLHQLDRAQGTAHFETSEDLGKELIQELTKVLPGYAIPRYVREQQGEPSKTRIL